MPVQQTNNFFKIAAQLDEKTERVTDETSAEILVNTKALAPILTGALQASYDRARIPGGWAIYSPLDYAPDQDLGRLGRPGTPHLTPAADTAWPRFITGMQQIFVV